MGAPKTRTGGAARAGRRASTRVGAGEGAGNLRPINSYIGGLGDAQRSYARSYLGALTRGTSMGAAVTRAADAGVSDAARSRIEREIDSRSRRLTDRRRSPNR